MLDIIGPPYTPEFVQSFLPLLENDDIVGVHHEDEKNPVSSFIGTHSAQLFDSVHE